jgi:hypothetical protein
MYTNLIMGKNLLRMVCMYALDSLPNWQVTNLVRHPTER